MHICHVWHMAQLSSSCGRTHGPSASSCATCHTLDTNTIRMLQRWVARSLKGDMCLLLANRYAAWGGNSSQVTEAMCAAIIPCHAMSCNDVPRSAACMVCCSLPCVCLHAVHSAQRAMGKEAPR